MQHNDIYLPRTAQGWLYRCLSYGASGLYRLVVAGRNTAYDRGLLTTRRLPGFVVSVGNIAVGGTGKTPVVIALARFLVAAGARPAILSRGYKSRLGAQGTALLVGGQVRYVREADELGQADEAMLTSHLLPHVPVILGARRYLAAHAYLASLKEAGEEAPTHWILDDGFQHRSLARDLNMLLIAADEPFGNGCLLPAGSLREPPAALQRADMILLTRSPAVSAQLQGARSQLPQVPASTTIYAVPFESTKPQALSSYDPQVSQQGGSMPHEPASPPSPALVVTGIARPQRLMSDLRKQGVEIAEQLCVKDHDPIPRQQLVAKSAQCACLITTCKDYWRDPSVFAGLPLPVYIVDTLPQLPMHEIGRYLLANATSFNLK